jgi:hypothetical protein
VIKAALKNQLWFAKTLLGFWIMEIEPSQRQHAVPILDAALERM